MSWEQPTTESGETHAGFGAESPEAVEARKQRWRRLRSFALAASLVLNGGFLAERAAQSTELEKLEGDLEAGGGVNFVIKGAEKGTFHVTRAANGDYDLEGAVTRTGKEVKLRYRLPASEDMDRTIEDLKKGNPMAVVSEMIELATTGTITSRDPDTGITHENSFDQADAGVTSREVVYDAEGGVTDKSELQIGMGEPMPADWQPSGAGDPNAPSNPLPGGIPRG